MSQPAPLSAEGRRRARLWPAAARAAAAYLPALAWAAFVYWLGGRTDVVAPDLELPFDKAAHFALYGVLGALLARGWRAAGRRPRWVWPFLLACVVGTADELHQMAVPGRTPETADWLADLGGAALGFALLARGRRNEDDRESE